MNQIQKWLNAHQDIDQEYIGRALFLDVPNNGNTLVVLESTIQKTTFVFEYFQGFLCECKTERGTFAYYLALIPKAQYAEFYDFAA